MSRLSKRLLAIGLVTALHVPQLATASESSRKLTARGLFLLQTGYPDDARKVFEEAVNLDPKDVDARYYRGMLRGSNGDMNGALEDLRVVLAAKPDFPQAALELGVGLVQAGQYTESESWLKQAQRVPALESKASLYLGLAQLRLGQLDSARSNFERVSTTDAKLAQAARYYVGVVDYQQGNFGAARERFAAVVAQSTGSAFEREAETFIRIIENGDQRPYHLRGSVGFEYDTNVILAPDDQVLKEQAGVSNEADGRFTIGAGGYYGWILDPVRMSIGYDFFQSLHFDLHEYNLQDHRPAMEVNSQAGPLQFGILGQYSFYLKEVDTFLQEGIALPWLAVDENDIGRSEVFYRMRRRDFLQDQFDVRDAFNHSFGIRQVIYLGSRQRYVALAYRFDTDDPVNGGDADRFAYAASEVSTDMAWDLPFEIMAQAGYGFRRETYDKASNVYVNGVDARRDNEHDIVASLSRDLNDILSLRLGYSGTINDSNAAAFKYDRHITSINLQARW